MAYAKLGRLVCRRSHWVQLLLGDLGNFFRIVFRVACVIYWLSKHLFCQLPIHNEDFELLSPKGHTEKVFDWFSALHGNY